MLRALKTAGMAAILVCTFLSVSFAGTTDVFDHKNPSSELDLWEILQDIAEDETGLTLTRDSSWSYGSSIAFEDSGGNTVVEYFRVEDTGNTLLDIKLGYANVHDRHWKDGTTKITAEAKFAGHNHELGWVDNTNGDAKTVLFGSTKDQIGTSKTTKFSANFDWYLLDKNTQKTWYSDDQLNVGDKMTDHMVTFEMRDGDGNAFKGVRTWVAAWEDLDSCSWDQDYNDLAVMFHVVPLPSAAWIGLAGLLGLAGLRRIRRRS